MFSSWVHSALPAWVVRRYVLGVRVGLRGSLLVPFGLWGGRLLAISGGTVFILQGEWSVMSGGVMPLAGSVCVPITDSRQLCGLSLLSGTA